MNRFTRFCLSFHLCLKCVLMKFCACILPRRLFYQYEVCLICSAVFILSFHIFVSHVFWCVWFYFDEILYSALTFYLTINKPVISIIYVAMVFRLDFGGWGESTIKVLLKIHQYLCNPTTYERFVYFARKFKGPSSK